MKHDRNWRERAKGKGYVVDRKGKLEHREVYLNAGFAIPPGWVVHHINEKKDDNRLENLMAMPGRFHVEMHHDQRINGFRYTREQLIPQVEKARIEWAVWYNQLVELRKKKEDLEREIAHFERLVS